MNVYISYAKDSKKVEYIQRVSEIEKRVKSKFNVFTSLSHNDQSFSTTPLYDTAKRLKPDDSEIELYKELIDKSFAIVFCLNEEYSKDNQYKNERNYIDCNRSKYIVEIIAEDNFKSVESDDTSKTNRSFTFLEIDDAYNTICGEGLIHGKVYFYCIY